MWANLHHVDCSGRSNGIETGDKEGWIYVTGGVANIDIGDLLQVSGILWVLRFPPTIKLTATI